jgi:type I restriction enzyme S subunit
VSELPNSWTTFTLKDIGGTVGGKTPSKSNSAFWSARDLHWTSPKDMKSFRLTSSEDMISKLAVRDGGMRVLPKGSVLVVTRSGILAHTLPVAIADIETTINQDIKAIPPNGVVEPRYLAYVLRSKQQEILEKCSKEGTTVASIQTELLESLPLPLAPPAEQKRIADKLDRLLAAVDTCKARLDAIPGILKRFRQSVLAAAVSGELTEEWRVSNEIVEPWDRVRVSEICEIQNGRAFPSGKYVDSGVRLLRPGNLSQSGIVEWNERNTVCLPGSFVRDFPEFLLGAGELLMNLTAQSLKDEFLGRVCLKYDSKPALLNQRIARFIPKLQYDVRPWLFLVFRSPMFRKFVDSLDTGTLIRHMHSKQVRDYEVCLPTVAEQTEIIRRVEGLFAAVDKIQANVDRTRVQVSGLTEKLLRKAFGGGLVTHTRGERMGGASSATPRRDAFPVMAVD